MTAILPHIAFIGRAGSGKSAAAELLVKHYGYEKLSFAAPLKVGCGTSTDRGLLQKVGQGVRDLCDDFWVNLFVDQLHDRKAIHRFTVDDARYPNEVVRLRMEGFITVRVVTHHSLRVARLRANGKLQDEAQLQHISETALDGFTADHTIDNSGGPDELLEQLVEILNKERR